MPFNFHPRCVYYRHIYSFIYLNTTKTNIWKIKSGFFKVLGMQKSFKND